VSELIKAPLSHVSAWKPIEKRLSGLGRQALRPILSLTVAILTGAFFALQYWHTSQTIFQFNPQVFPVQAMDWLEMHPQRGNMLNEFNWGGYILYRAWPQERVFLDSQSDFYGEPLMRDYDQITSVQGDWENLLEKYQVRWTILPSHEPLTKELMAQGWKAVYQDQTAVILVRDDSRQSTASIMIARKMNTK
jgi:hypothetical protein